MANWDYSDVRSKSTGTMQCSGCHKQITEGEFRYRQKSKRGDWGYVQQHRDCSADDPRWAELDAKRLAAAAEHKRFVAACIAFRDEWGVVELDDYIPEATNGQE